MPHFECAERSTPGTYEMNTASASFRESRSSLVSRDTPVVFVVDDDISVRESLELLIRFAGFQPQTFPSAEEFLSRPRVFVPSCLVLDVTLPDLNGLDLQKRIATDRRSERVGLPRSADRIGPSVDR